MDHGVEGLLETMKNLDEYGIAHVGAGNNADEAYAPVIREVNGIKIAYVGTSRVLPVTTWKANRYDAGLAESYDPTQTLKSIEDLEDEADITVVLVHWGQERFDNPDENQLSLAKKYIDAGADLVVGSHPHVLQGFEQYNGKWIAYSLGNFAFSANPQGRQAETGVLTAICTMQSDCELQFAPMKVVNAQPTPVEEQDAKTMLKFLEKISIGGVKIDERGNITVR
jgi:poly-gamma-glutamate capsule biosynthesis protein CapA/YwtB (metallophosphatase superfamily)